MATLTVEILEDRTVPATITVGNGPGQVPLLSTAIQQANTNASLSNRIVFNLPANTTIDVPNSLTITKDVTIDGSGVVRLPSMATCPAISFPFPAQGQ
jgi:hypothetical protein